MLPGEGGTDSYNPPGGNHTHDERRQRTAILCTGGAAQCSRQAGMTVWSVGGSERVTYVARDVDFHRLGFGSSADEMEVLLEGQTKQNKGQQSAPMLSRSRGRCDSTLRWRRSEHTPGVAQGVGGWLAYRARDEVTGLDLVPGCQPGREESCNTELSHL